MTKKQLLKTIEQFQGRMFFTHELADKHPLDGGAEPKIIGRHLRELGKAGKLHLIKDNGRKESDIWCAVAEPVGFATDAGFVRFGVREK